MTFTPTAGTGNGGGTGGGEAPVPEPSTIALFLTTVGGLGCAGMSWAGGGKPRTDARTDLKLTAISASDMPLDRVEGFRCALPAPMNRQQTPA